MKFQETLPGAYLIEIEPQVDERGFFARIFCEREFREHGLVAPSAQSSISFNKKKGTLRGLHFQKKPHEEVKLVRCTKGMVYDVLLDLRPDSPAFKKWVGFELSDENRRTLYVPAGVAHGFITMRDNCEMHYQISPGYFPESASGVRWDDAAFSIAWPFQPTVISERDTSFPNFKD